LGANAGDEGKDVESVPGFRPVEGERRPFDEALLIVDEVVFWRASPMLGVPVTPFGCVDCWAAAGSGEAASFMEVKVGGGDRRLAGELLASLVRG
jgi:hypothetical protein